MSRSLSIVVPLFNEAESLRRLHEELDTLAQRQDYELQIVLVDDGSTDASWTIIESLAAADARVQGIRLRRNFGKAAGLMAGFAAATAPVVVTLDADLQDRPHEIPRLVALVDEGADLVSGWKIDRQDPWHKRWPSKVFNWLVSRMTGVSLHDHNCGLKAYRREVTQELRLHGEMHRFVPVLAAARGFRIAEIAVEHAPRQYGVSKYGWSRLIKGLLDLITVRFLTGYGDRPQHLLGAVGLASFMLGALSLVYLAAKWIGSRVLPGFEPVNLHETAALYYAVAACVVGGQFLSIGLLGELIASYISTERRTYSIAETTSGLELPSDRRIETPGSAR